MPRAVTKYSVLIASPSDVRQDCDFVAATLIEWSRDIGRRLEITIEPVMWETHSTPGMGRPQTILNRDLVDDCDVIVALFWTHLGSHTGEAESGTLEEIDRCHKSGKPVMLYFSNVPISLGKVDIDQFQKLSEFKKWCQDKALYGEYETVLDLRRKIYRDITRKMDELHRLQHEADDQRFSTNSGLPKTNAFSSRPDYFVARGLDQDMWGNVPPEAKKLFITLAKQDFVEQGIDPPGVNALNSMALGLWRKEKHAVQSLQKELLAARGRSGKSGLADDVRKAASRLPRETDKDNAK